MGTLSLPTPPTITRLHWLAGVVLVTACVGCDQMTKRLATSALRGAAPRSYCSGLVRLEYALNPGGFLSLGSQLPAPVRPWIFVGINSILMAALLAYLCARRSLTAVQRMALLLALAGGIGNLIDRVSNQGLVIDFVCIGYGPLRTGIFNVADLAVTFGSIAALVLMRRRANDPPTGLTAAQTLPIRAAG
jgi:signal peptidase II